MGEKQPTERFSERAPYYHANRPRYAPAVLDLMAQRLGLTPASIIADVGAGTGILSEMFLKNGNTVYAVEPNAEMRALSETYYGQYPNFIPVNGAAEATGLPAAIADFVVCGQAFHWFNPPRTRAEFRRILKLGGYVALLWNTRQDDKSPFLQAYNRLVRAFDLDGSENRVRGIERGGSEAMRIFFEPGGFESQTFDNAQTCDFEGLRGRLLSASYLPLPDHPRYPAMMAEAQAIFDRFQQDGLVSLDYHTEMYWGRLL
ncbi:MAG: methyltransferase domain-containing protein [Chloroflexi bacterium]|nr:methyltransferase domain-containing protein [Chloroflexota bacterium]MDL1882569.1 methyltransferase domain-containing protein [Anaerolineae bacterium CFX8]